MAYAGNLGYGGSALDAQYGSSALPNSNEPTLYADATTPYLQLPRAFPNIATSPNSVPLQITGDIDIAVRILPVEWQPSVAMTVLAKWIFGGASYRLYLSAAGVTLETFGAATVGASASLSFLTGVAQPVWLRATRDVDNGAGGNTTVFYWSAEENEPTSWTEIATVVNTGTTSINVASILLEIGADGGFGFNLYGGRIYRTIIRNGIDGLVVFDADFSTALVTGAETTFAEGSSNAATVTIGRATSGRKSVGVVRPVWLLGADDYFEVASSPLLDFAAGEAMTVLVVARSWATQVAGDALASRSAAGVLPTGWRLLNGTSPLQPEGTVGDGASEAVATGPARVAGQIAAMFLVRDTATGTLSAWTDAAEGTPVADATASLANSLPLRLGATAAAAGDYADVELFAAAVWRRALSADEMGAVLEYYGL